MEARLARLRDAIKDDLDKLPDLPSKVEPASEMEATAAQPTSNAQPKPAARPNLSSILWPESQPDLESDDSEADCEVQFIRVEDEERIEELEKNYPSNEDAPAIASTTLGRGMSKGQLTPIGQGFAAIVALSKFPYRNIPKNESENVADRFFNGGKFFMREWDL
jgi:hypothetical protein